MNLDDLNNLRYLDAEIREYRKASGELEDCGYRDALDKKVAELIERKHVAFEFVAGIKDSQTRQIIFLRFIKGMTWGQVALKVGGGNTSDGVRKRAVRYIQSDMSDGE